MEKWVVMAKKADFNAIAETFGIDPVVARIIRNRDIVGDDAIREYLYGGKEYLKDPLVLKDMDRAAGILKEKIREGKKIRIVGDYDIDGIMASYILLKGFTELGAVCDVRIPDRIRDGYGINAEMADQAAFDGIDTIVTCDNGISAAEAIARAKSQGLTVIVTDHHEVLQLPEADAVVDPKREDDSSGSEDLCGASVAWKLILAMGGDRELSMLQYAAFATVGDIVSLTGENRIIVKEGMKQLRNTDNLGLRMLAEQTGVRMADLSVWQIGFILGPCLNASGRLDSAEKAMELLNAGSEFAANRIAGELKELNESRKSLTESGVRQAREEVEAKGLEQDRILVVFLPGVHESIAGIIAGRLRELYLRPAFVLTRSAEGVKGSGRSTEQYSMFEELSRASHLLTRFGGHAMAAGLSLREEKIPELRRLLNENCALSLEELSPRVRIDVPMPVSYVTEELVKQLELLEPFGKGNEKPLFAQKHVYVDHPRVFGANHTLLRARVRSMRQGGSMDPDRPGFHADLEGPEIDAVCFKDVDALMERVRRCPELSIVYEAGINNYMNQNRLQLVIRYYR